MGWREEAEAAGMALEVAERQKLLDRLVVGGVSVLGSAIVVAVVIFVVVDKMNQLPHTALVLLPDPFNNQVIRFRPSDNDTYSHYVDHLSEYIDGYSKEQSTDPLAVNCSAGRCPTGKKVCLFDIKQLGSQCVRQRTYGFHAGQPCVLIFFKPPMDWDPENFNRSSVPEPLRARWRPQHLGVHCEGQTELDTRRMGNLEYWPPEGFPMSYFPYQKKPNFRPPLLMLRFLDPTPDVLINIRCQIHAANIKPPMTQYYMNFFSVMMDIMEPHSKGALENTTSPSPMSNHSVYNVSGGDLYEALNSATVPSNTLAYENTLSVNEQWLNHTEAVTDTATSGIYVENITMVSTTTNTSHVAIQMINTTDDLYADMQPHKTFTHSNASEDHYLHREQQSSSTARSRT